jgi:hypothetical protein
VRRLIADDFRNVLRTNNNESANSNKVDIILTPVTSDVAPLYSQFRRNDDGYTRERTDDYFTQPANMSGALNCIKCYNSNNMCIRCAGDINSNHTVIWSTTFDPIDGCSWT